MYAPSAEEAAFPGAALTAQKDAAESFKVLVAGAGVGGLEAILALREVSRPEIAVELLSPDESYLPTPLSVVEPFGGRRPREVSLIEFCGKHDVEFTRDRLAEVWPGQQRVLTDSGTELYYDALLLSIGARHRPAVNGAITFGGSGDVEAIERLLEAARREGGRIAFVSPPAAEWTLPLYELALLTADRLQGRAQMEIVTCESRALEAFGRSASELVGELLGDAGITLHAGVEDPADFAKRLPADRLVSLPRLWVAEIPDIPQHRHGFLPVDAEMRVAGVDNVWAVGDVTWSPIKQGGLAAQQADVAAAGIAATAGAAVEIPAYAPVLRAALMTADGPYYLRSGTPDADGELRAPLWWPPAKIAGRLLAGYLSQQTDPSVADTELIDLPSDERRDADHREAHELALHWADLDSQQGDLRRALHWLDIAERLELVLPEDYERKRVDWRRRLAES